MNRDERDLIKARRKAIKAAAPCEGCGMSLSACKAERGKDPTAPSWFGCCARGLVMRPCRHVPDQRALQDLLKEVEAGRVRSPEDLEMDKLLDSIGEFPRRRLFAGICMIPDCGCSGLEHP